MYLGPPGRQRNISGDIQYKLPEGELTWSVLEKVFFDFARPKSPILTEFSESFSEARKMLDDLRSRWTICFEWRYSIPYLINYKLILFATLKHLIY